MNALTWHFTLRGDDERRTVTSFDRLPEKEPLAWLGLGFTEQDMFFAAVFDEDVTPFVEESLNGYNIGWTRLGRESMCQIVPGKTIWLSSYLPSDVPARDGWEPPILHWRAWGSEGPLNAVRYEDIDRERCKAFALTDRKGRAAAGVLLESGQRLIWRRRVTTDMTVTSGGTEWAGSPQRFLYLCGYQESVAGQNNQAMLWVPEGEHLVMMRGRFSADALYRPVQLHEQER